MIKVVSPDRWLNVTLRQASTSFDFTMTTKVFVKAELTISLLARLQIGSRIIKA